MILYCKYAAMHIRSALQYRLSFFLTVIAQFMNTTIEFLGMFLLFDRFGMVAGYSLGEAALCFAVAHGSFAIAECAGRGFDIFSQQIRTGDFDRLLVRPRSLIAQIFGSAFDLTRIGRLTECAIVLVFALSMLETIWTPLRSFTVVFMLLGGACVFIGVFILGATFAFHSVQAIEIVNIFSDGGRQLNSYPLPIYAKPVRFVFTFLIPFASINYLPLHFVASRSDNVMYAFLPFVGILFLIPCIAIFYHLGVRKYVSTGN